MFESVQGLLAEHEAVQAQLADPAVHADLRLARKVNRRYAELSGIVAAYDRWDGIRDDLAAARELANEDARSPRRSPASRPRWSWRRPSCGAC